MTKIIYSLSLFFLLFQISSCSSDKATTPVDPFAGQYKLVQAKLLEATTPATFPANDIASTTALVAGSLFGTYPCATTANNAIDVRLVGTGKELYYICVTETGKEAKAGTWASPNSTQLDFNFAPPLFTPAFSLSVTEIKVTGTNLVGKATLPIPGVFFSAFGLTIDPATTILLKTELTFTKIK